MSQRAEDKCRANFKADESKARTPQMTLIGARGDFSVRERKVFGTTAQPAPVSMRWRYRPTNRHRTTLRDRSRPRPLGPRSSYRKLQSPAKPLRAPPAREQFSTNEFCAAAGIAQNRASSINPVAAATESMINAAARIIPGPRVVDHPTDTFPPLDLHHRYASAVTSSCPLQRANRIHGEPRSKRRGHALRNPLSQKRGLSSDCP